HADQAIGRHGVLHHGEIAGLENIERQMSVAEKERAGQRENRQYRWEFVKSHSRARVSHEKSRDESRRRRLFVNGLVAPRRSSSLSSSCRPAASFHSRSRRMISRNSSPPAS